MNHKYIRSSKLIRYYKAELSLPGRCKSKAEGIATVRALTILWKDVLQLSYAPEVAIWKSMLAPLGCSSQGELWTIFVNPTKLTLSRVYLNYAVLHEFSHIILGGSEYKATRFALSIIKIYYTEQYFKLVCRAIAKRLTRAYLVTNPDEYYSYTKALRLTRGLAE